MGQEIDKFLGEEVFVAGVEDDFSIDAGSDDLFICKTIEGLYDHLNTMTPTMDSNVRVLHGVLANGVVLPSSLRRRSVFFILPNVYIDDGVGCLRDADVSSVDELAAKITEMVRQNEYFIFNPEEIYVLYGYEIKVTLGIAEDDVDDEAVSASRKIVEEVKQIARSHGIGGKI